MLKGGMPCEDRDRDWSDVAVSQEAKDCQQPLEARKKQGKILS